jgi:hypothetical protein
MVAKVILCFLDFAHKGGRGGYPVLNSKLVPSWEARETNDAAHFASGVKIFPSTSGPSIRSRCGFLIPSWYTME